MKTSWEFPLYKVILLFFAGIMIGVEISLLATNNTKILGGILQIVSMLFVSIAVLISCRKRQGE